MKKNISIIIVLLIIISSPNFAQDKKAQIVIGPDIQVSKDGNFMHDEFMLAANPKDPNNLIGAVQVFSFNGNSKNCKVYITKDGGNSWNGKDFSEQVEFGGGDPQMAFGLHGEAYFVAICSNKKYTLSFYKSTDGGESWEKPVNIGDNLYGLPREFDHEQITVDHSFGKFAGRIYISGLSAELDKFSNDKFPHQSVLHLFRSEDNGKSFIGPIKMVSGEVTKGLNVTNLLVSSKGTLFFTYREWCNDTSIAGYYSGMQAYLITSNDGGITFSPPIKVLKYKDVDYGQWAIDNQSEKYKDRLYFVYQNDFNEKNGLFLIYSDDDGKTWSVPKKVDSNQPGDADQYRPAITVSRQGVVGVRWYDTRGTELRKGYNEYFAASIDGGETFLPAVKVSSVISKEPDFNSELAVPFWRRNIKDSLITFFTASAGPLGGHYYQFTADAAGVFHDFWADSRDGRAFQVYTSAIKVVRPSDKDWKDNVEAVTYLKKEKKSFELNPKNRSLKNISKDIFLEMDAVNYDTITSVLSIPIRIKNISDKPIYGPIKLGISKIDTSGGKNAIPVMLSLENKKKGLGALNSPIVLLPDEKTETLIWRLKVKISKKIVKYPKELVEQFHLNKDYTIDWSSNTIADLHINVTGYVAR